LQAELFADLIVGNEGGDCGAGEVGDVGDSGIAVMVEGGGASSVAELSDKADSGSGKKPGGHT
jgi:hypothetical protein